MANDLTNFTPEMWSNRVQILLENNLVGAAISNTEERSVLSYGDVVHRPYHSEIYATDYSKGTDVTFQDVSTTDESLTVDQAKIVPVFVDRIDDIQNKYRTIDILAERAAYELRDQMDRKILAEVSNASLGNSSTITLSTANVVQSFSNAKAALFNNGTEATKKWCAVIDPDTVSIIEQYFGANGFRKQDAALMSGYGANSYLGEWLGLEMYQSQNLPSAVSLGIATNVSEGDTVVINGVTFTFNATPSGAGSVDIGANAAGSVTNLVAAINDTGTAGTTYIQLSNADRAKLIRRGVTATDNTTAVGLVAAGKMTLSETLTDGTDGFGDQTIDNIIQQKGAIDLVLQEAVMSEFKDPPKRLGVNILTWDLYGTKTFVEGAQRMYGLTLKVS